jgi:1-aminocyclopropane-1-carboxylate deaminase/D-cysteine desulfhydrase-like pyridoxal-dependent ACC family enzyme
MIQDLISDPERITPWQRLGDIFVKRDDLFGVAGVRGGKCRTCLALSRPGRKEGLLSFPTKGFTTAGSRSSPQVNIVAHIAQHYHLPCRVHTPSGELYPELVAAQEAGATIVQHPAGYNNVIIARAREDAAARGWTYIPFGMECHEAVQQTSGQVRGMPSEVLRLVVPVGSGMSLSGILHGLDQFKRKIPVIGVMVGADPTKRLNTYAPLQWRSMVRLVPSGSDYHQQGKTGVAFRGITIDPGYEAKCIPFLLPGDAFWIVGIRGTCT